MSDPAPRAGPAGLAAAVRCRHERHRPARPRRPLKAETEAAPVLPDSLLADAEAGRPVRFRHPRTGAELRFVAAPAPPSNSADAGEEDDILSYEQWRQIQIEIDGGEISEVEALRRALAYNEAEAAAGRGPQPVEEMFAELSREFPGIAAAARRAGFEVPE